MDLNIALVAKNLRLVRSWNYGREWNLETLSPHWDVKSLPPFEAQGFLRKIDYSNQRLWKKSREQGLLNTAGLVYIWTPETVAGCAVLTLVYASWVPCTEGNKHKPLSLTPNLSSIDNHSQMKNNPFEKTSIISHWYLSVSFV